MQQFLGTSVSGSFDAPTVNAIAGFQDGQGLGVDGMVGTKTKRALRGAGVVEETEKKAVAPGVNTKGTPGGADPKSTKPGPAEQVTPSKSADIAGAQEQKPKPTATFKSRDKNGKVVFRPVGAPPQDFGEGNTLSLASFAAWATQAADKIDEGMCELADMAPDDPQLASLQAALTGGAAALQAAGEALRTQAIKLINDSSLLKRPDAQPVFPSKAELGAFLADLRRIGAAGGDMTAASHVCQDAVLAIQQGASAMSARATWALKPGEAEGAADIAAQKKKKDDPLNAIFKDAGYSSTVATQDGKPDKIADWCGMFVGASLVRGGGLDEELRAGMLHTDNVQSYFKYVGGTRTPKSIWADGEWHDLKTYHGGRGAVRGWQDRASVTATMEGGAALDVRPGDVVLIDHGGNSSSPQHITMVESYDAETKQLTTIEGNTSGIRPASDGKVEQVGDDGTHYKENKSGLDGSGLHTRDMTNMSKGSRETHADQHAANMANYNGRPKGSYKGTKGSTVFGVGRPSAVDFEEHEYAVKTVPADMKLISPTEMKAKAAKQVGLKKAQ